MAIESPSINVYYYECSNGLFRLTYFLPPGELERLCSDKSISLRLLEEFPDGVDIGCTESDFKDFEETYYCRPQIDPDTMRRVFFAIFSATRNWKKFCGSGFIPAADLESHLENVDGILLKKKLIPVDAKPQMEKLSLKHYRQRRRRRAIQQKQAYSVLQKLRVKGIDPERTLPQQAFSPIKMAEGAGAEDVFIRLHQKKRKKE